MVKSFIECSEMVVGWWQLIQLREEMKGCRGGTPVGARQNAHGEDFVFRRIFKISNLC